MYRKIEEIDEKIDKKNPTILDILIDFLENKNKPSHNFDTLKKNINNKIKNIMKKLKNKYKLDENSLLYLNISYIDSFKDFGNGINLDRKIETNSYINTFLKNACIDITNIYKNYFINFNESNNKLIKIKDNKSNILIPEHWNLSEIHAINISEDICNEIYTFFDKDMSKIKTELDSSLFLENKLKLLNKLTKLIPNISKHQTVLKSIYKYLFILIIYTYFKNSDEKTYKIYKIIINKYVDVIIKTKKILNVSDSEIKTNIEKLKEKEKEEITKKFKDLKPEERQVENLLKENRLGEWSLGQTKALWKYDAIEYEKELEKKMLQELEKEKKEIIGDNNSLKKISQLKKKLVYLKNKTVNDDSEVKQFIDGINEGIDSSLGNISDSEISNMDIIKGEIAKDIGNVKPEDE